MTHMANEQYEQSVIKWRQEVDANLRRENGWLALSGLFWLRKGINVIGSDPDCDIVIPQRAPRRLEAAEDLGVREAEWWKSEPFEWFMQNAGRIPMNLGVNGKWLPNSSV